jgi:hypothetical protein
MVALRFSFIPRGSYTQWKCNITVVLEKGNDVWFIPLEEYHVPTSQSQIIKTSTNINVSEYVTKNTFLHDNLDDAIEATKVFTRDIKQFVEMWKSGPEQAGYEIVI